MHTIIHFEFNSGKLLQKPSTVSNKTWEIYCAHSPQFQKH